MDLYRLLVYDFLEIIRDGSSIGFLYCQHTEVLIQEEFRDDECASCPVEDCF